VEWFSLFLELARWHPHSASPFWHSPTSSFRFGHRTFWIRFEPSRSRKTLADATPPLPCFYPHSEWAASGARCKLGSDLIPRSITAVMNLGLLGLPSIARSLYRPALTTQSPEQGGGCRCLPNLLDRIWFSLHQLRSCPPQQKRVAIVLSLSASFPFPLAG
jgi:hypothetical protein